MTKKDTKKFICCKCNESLVLSTHFYRSYSPLFASGHVPMCKKCMQTLFCQYVAEYRDYKKALKRMCILFDLYYSQSICDSCCGEDEAVEAMLGNYLKRLNMVQFKGKTFETSLKEGFSFVEDFQSKKKKNEEEEEVISPEDVERWGFGFTAADYKTLNNHYNLLKDANPQSESNNQEIFITDLCYTKMQQMKAVREGDVDAFNKLTDSYRKSFTQAGLKTVRDTAADEELTLGVGIETIEKYTPAEYYKNKELFKDHDNIGNYIERFLYRPLRNLMTGTKDRDIEYFVREEEEVDDYGDSD